MFTKNNDNFSKHVQAVAVSQDAPLTEHVIQDLEQPPVVHEYDANLPDESVDEVIAELEMQIADVEIAKIRQDSHANSRIMTPKNQELVRDESQFIVLGNDISITPTGKERMDSVKERQDASYSIIAPTKSILKKPTPVNMTKSVFAAGPSDNTQMILEDINKHKEHHRSRIPTLMTHSMPRKPTEW